VVATGADGAWVTIQLYFKRYRTKTGAMIVRTWTARATEDGARRYHAYFAGTLLPELRRIPGFRGAYLLAREEARDEARDEAREEDGTVELTAHTLWESTDAIRAFAGGDIATAIVEPEAQGYLRDFDPTVTHRTVLTDAV
jgi:heme-degrading monooxygenase HmoA